MCIVGDRIALTKTLFSAAQRVGVYVWVRSAFAFARKKYFVVKFAKGGFPEERAGILRFFFCQSF